jgi:DHA2 family multidrug resistance protein
MLERGESKDWFESREIVTEGILAAIGLIGFVWHELRTEHPIVDLRILKNRQLAVGVTFAVLLGFALYSSVFALPVFLQNVLGFTAWDTGKVILPGAIASAVAMAMMGRLAPRVDARILITIGVLMFLTSMWMHYHFTVDTGMHDLLLPMVLRGFGIGLVFVPLTSATVADLQPGQIPQGTGLFNLSRQLGGSFGIAVTATLLSRFTDHARNALASHLTASDAATRGWLDAVTGSMQRFGGTMAEAQLKASAVLGLKLAQQASVFAFEKVFLIMGLSFTAVLPLLLLFRTGRARGGGMAH